MAIEGKLGIGGGADLLSAVWKDERTGLLDVAVGGVNRKLVLAAGEIVYVTSSDVAEKLPIRLIQKGLVAKETLVAAGKAGGDLRKALAATGALDPAVHDRELSVLVAEVVERLFPMTTGTWSLLDKTDLGLEGVLEQQPMVPLMWRAARSVTPEFASAFLGKHDQRVVRGSDEALADITDLGPQEGYLLSRIDGYSSVTDLVGMSPLGPEPTLRFLMALTVVGVIDVASRPGIKLPRAAKPSGRKRKRSTTTPAAKPASTAPVAAPPAPGVITVEAALAGPAEGIEAVRDLLVRSAELDNYGVLGLKPAADEGEIRKAYYALARVYHPDRFGKDTAEADRERVEALFSRISEAFSVLSDPELRKEYDDKLKSGALAAEKEERKPVDKKELARESFEKARGLIAMGDKARAMRFLEHAVEVDKDSFEYRMALARLLMSDTRTRKRAEQHLQEAIRIDQTKADAYHQLGILYKAAGVKSRAMDQFRLGLKWDATHAGILAEIAELDSKGDGGVLGGLFGKRKS